MLPPNRLKYTPDPNKFDLRTHVWDGQGRLVEKNLYRTHIMDGIVYYERPVNSGNLWFENNQPAGRMELTFGENGKISKKELKLGAAHVAYTAPLEGAEKMHYELEHTRTENEALKAELAAIKKERNRNDMVKAVQEGVPPSDVKLEQAPPKLSKPGAKTGV